MHKRLRLPQDASDDGLTAHARRCFAANGFGDAAAGIHEGDLRPSVDPYSTARFERSRRLARLIGAGLQAMAATSWRFVTWCRHRLDAAAARHALDCLDESALRDLGLDRAEIAGHAGRTPAPRDRHIRGLL